MVFKKININNGESIRYISSIVPKPITKKYVNEILTQYLRDSNNAKKIADHLFNNRATYNKVYLKRNTLSKKNTN